MSWTILPAYRRRGHHGLTRDALNELPRSELTEAIRANPAHYAARQRHTDSSAAILGPSFAGGSRIIACLFWSPQTAPTSSCPVDSPAFQRSTRLAFRYAIKRVARTRGCFRTVPSNMFRCWTSRDGTIELRRSGAELPSRAADNIFWLGRQLERAEAAARLLRSTASRMTGETRSASDLELPVLLRCLADTGHIEPATYAVEEMWNSLPAIESVLPTSVFDTSQPNCLRSVLDELFRLGSIVRDRVSLDTWRTIRRIDEGFQPPRTGVANLSDLLALTDELITELSAFSGIVMDSMTRTQGFPVSRHRPPAGTFAANDSPGAKLFRADAGSPWTGF